MAETENKASEQFDVFERQSAVLEEQSEQASDRELEQQDWQNRVERNAMRHVANLVGNHADRTDVEYQRARLERVILVGVWSSYETSLAQAEESLRELAALADTAGAEVVDGLLQRRDHPDAATYIGSGKAKELAQMVESNDADTIIVNADLPPSQRRALEKLTGIHVIDRTAVILDIFAQHATSREGKAQVELAQLQYMLPRLRGWGQTLSRQAGGQSAGQMGGIGSRGPGETKLEMNRRVIHKRISKLKADITAMEPTRRTKRDSRRRNDIPTVSVVGYTNAGKSSLTNALTGSQELVRNALFATLDTAVRSAKTRSGRTYAYADTVGFVSDLPTQLVEAFKSTLEEISSSDVIVHVVDASSVDVDQHITTVNDILADIDGVEAIPRLLAFNKVDLITQAQLHRLKELYPDAAFVSAASGVGIEQLQHAVEALLPRPHVRVDVLLPYDAGALVAQVRVAGQIEQLDYEDEGIHLQAFVGDSLAAKLLAASQ